MNSLWRGSLGTARALGQRKVRISGVAVVELNPEHVILARETAVEIAQHHEADGLGGPGVDPGLEHWDLLLQSLAGVTVETIEAARLEVDGEQPQGRVPGARTVTSTPERRFGLPSAKSTRSGARSKGRPLRMAEFAIHI
jgi:hypothetical protein